MEAEAAKEAARDVLSSAEVKPSLSFIPDLFVLLLECNFVTQQLMP